MPKVAKLQKEPLARRAVHAIRDAIFAGEYVPGQMLTELLQKEADAREGSHRRIVDAICAADASAARTAMQKHVLTIGDAVHLLESLSLVFETAPKSADVM